MSYKVKIFYVSGRQDMIFFFDEEEKDSFLKTFNTVRYKSNKSAIVKTDNNGSPLYINLNNIEKVELY